VTSDRFLRLPEVLAATGLTRSSLYRRIGAGGFPAQVRIGPQMVAWRQSEVERWIADPASWNIAA
jgi:prophage regulatory protein